MRNNIFLASINFAVFTIIAVITVFIAIITYVYRDFSNASGLVKFAIINHFSIMIISMFILLGYGFFWSSMLQKQIKEQKEDTKDVFSIVMSFLSKEEKTVLHHLVKEQGESTQAKIAHLDDMGAVKALRTVQKMQEKKLLQIKKEGKVRRIHLDEKIIELLTSKKS
jgi:predicted transcriptional regulator